MQQNSFRGWVQLVVEDDVRVGKGVDRKRSRRRRRVVVLVNGVGGDMVDEGGRGQWRAGGQLGRIG